MLEAAVNSTTWELRVTGLGEGRGLLTSGRGWSGTVVHICKLSPWRTEDRKLKAWVTQ